jgi:hypothetical protein
MLLPGYPSACKPVHWVRHTTGFLPQHPPEWFGFVQVITAKVMKDSRRPPADYVMFQTNGSPQIAGKKVL